MSEKAQEHGSVKAGIWFNKDGQQPHREALLIEAAAAFPEDTAAYRALTKPPAAPAAPEQAPPVATEPAAR